MNRNKKYKPKKPIVYDTDRSLLHTASRNILNAINNDTIIGQPTFHNKPIKVGTEKVQVGTEKVQVGTKRVQVGTNTIKDIFGISETAVQNYSRPGEIMQYKIYLKANKPNTKSVTRFKQKNRNEVSNTVNCPVGQATLIKTAQMSSNFSNYEYYITDVYVDNKVVYTLNGPKSHPGVSGLTQVSYSEPIYEDQPVYEDRPVYENKPVYKDSPVKGLIMYLRRKGA